MASCKAKAANPSPPSKKIVEDSDIFFLGFCIINVSKSTNLLTVAYSCQAQIQLSWGLSKN